MRHVNIEITCLAQLSEERVHNKLKAYVVSRIWLCEWIINKEFITGVEAVNELYIELSSKPDFQYSTLNIIKRLNCIIEKKWIEFLKFFHPALHKGVMEYRKQWRRENKERINKISKERNKEAQRRYREKHPKMAGLYSRRYMKENREALNDQYIRHLLICSRIPKESITTDMIEDRRNKILYKRLAKQT